MLLIAATVVSPSFKLWNLFEGSRGGCTAWWMLEKSSVRELLSERYSLHHDRERELDHELVAPRVRELQAERSRLEATLGAHNQWRPLSVREIAEWADSLGGVVQVLKRATPEDRAALYAEFGLTLRYDPTRHQIKATAELSRVARGEVFTYGPDLGGRRVTPGAPTG
jgi:hypothetical protein